MDLDTLENRLSNNYDQIKDPLIIGDVLWFMETYPDPSILSDAPVRFIKKITKVASNCFDEKSDLFSFENIKWILDCSDLGIFRISRNDYENEISPENAQKIFGHLYAHNADLMEEISRRATRKEEQISWLKKAYALRKIAIGACEIDQQYCVHEFAVKGNLAVKIAELVSETHEKINWLKKAYDDQDNAIKKNDFDEELGVYQAGFKAGTAKRLAGLSKNIPEMIDWLNKAYRHCHEAGKKSQGFDKNFSARQFSFKGENATGLAELANDQKEKIHWLKKAYFSYGRAAKIIWSLDESYCGRQLSSKGALASKLVELEPARKIFWLKLGLEDNWFGAKMLKKIDSKNSAMCSLNAGRMAYELLQMVGGNDFEEKAILAYRTALVYFKKSNSDDLLALKKKVENLVKKLESSTQNETAFKEERKKSSRSFYKRKKFNWQKDFEKHG